MTEWREAARDYEIIHAGTSFADAFRTGNEFTRARLAGRSGELVGLTRSLAAQAPPSSPW